MGAKIHMHIEVKSSDTWYHYAAPAMFRDRVFFDLLGGIYNKEAAVVPPRGLPEDLSFVTKHDWDQDREGYRLHHPGWLKAEELWTLQEKLNERSLDSKMMLEHDLEAGLLHTYINGNALASHQGWDDLRFIFWFDN